MFKLCRTSKIKGHSMIECSVTSLWGFGSFIVRSAYRNSLVAVWILPTTNLSESDIKVSNCVHLIVESESSLYSARYAQQFWPTSNYASTEKTWPPLTIINTCTYMCLETNIHLLETNICFSYLRFLTFFLLIERSATLMFYSKLYLMFDYSIGSENDHI